jgi:ABC-type dipeptide/oligopeptide/nickel transport system permease subunit
MTLDVGTGPHARAPSIRHMPSPRRGAVGLALAHSPRIAVGLALLALLGLVALAAPWLAPRDPLAQDLSQQLAPPRLGGFPLGADHLGRDVLSRIIYGTRASLLVGLSAVGLGGIAGGGLGLVAGYFGGWPDRAISMVIDAFLSFPTLLLALAFIALLGSGLTNVVLAIALATWPGVARVMRGEVLRVRELDFVTAALAGGAADPRILRRHVLPNAWGPFAVVVTLSVGTAMLSEASLGFLGLGVAPPAPTWGRIVGEGAGYMRTAPWAIAFGGLAISLAVFAVSILGEGLRDAVTPAGRQEV